MSKSMFLRLLFNIKSLIPLILLMGLVEASEIKDVNFPTNLPKNISNNAVASLSRNGIDYIASFNGLTDSKKAEDITSAAFLWRSDSKQWQQLPNVPGDGKLASTAVAIGDAFYVIGGYTVAEDGTEKSTSEIYKLSYPYTKFELETKIPIAVDDSVSLVYQQRFIYLISGWHDHGNVSEVQIYDTKTQQWSSATPFPGIAVFGHTAAISDQQILLVDGVGVTGKVNGKNKFAIIDQAWLGNIVSSDLSKIVWTKIDNHIGKPRYRMAAFVAANGSQIIFSGGSDNPYNYNGIGYDGHPSVPVSQLLVFDLVKNCWLKNNTKGPDVMDLRGVVRYGEKIAIVGGMNNEQKVLGIAQQITYLPLSSMCN